MVLLGWLGDLRMVVYGGLDVLYFNMILIVSIIIIIIIRFM